MLIHFWEQSGGGVWCRQCKLPLSTVKDKHLCDPFAHDTVAEAMSRAIVGAEIALVRDQATEDATKLIVEAGRIARAYLERNNNANASSGAESDKAPE